ncbi:MAG: hypothetical protein WA009_01570, partial [Phototrophicaceae bacterium]
VPRLLRLLLLNDRSSAWRKFELVAMSIHVRLKTFNQSFVLQNPQFGNQIRSRYNAERRQLYGSWVPTEPWFQG